MGKHTFFFKKVNFNFVMKRFNMLKVWPAWTRDVLRLLEMGACDARADRAHGKLYTWREKEKKGKAVTLGMF